MLPKINTDIDNLIKDEKAVNGQSFGKSFLFDFSTGDFVVKDGKVVEIEDIGALRIWIEKVLRTEKLKFEVYEREDRDNEYGVLIQKLIMGQKYPKNFIESEIKREINKVLTAHPLIKSLSNWEITKEDISLDIKFQVNSVYGNAFNQEVNI